MTRRFAALLAASLLLSNAGCMTAAKRVFKEAKGATSKTRTIPNGSRDPYNAFKGATVSPATTEIEPLIAPDFMSALRIELVNQLTKGVDNDEPPLFAGGEPSLHIEPRVMWYHKPGAMGDILGTNSYTVVVYTISGGGGVMNRVQIVTKSAASRTDDTDMARSSAEELVKWFRERREGRFDEDEEAKAAEEQREKDRKNRKDRDSD